MIDVQKLTKQYGSLVAVRDVSFCVTEGTILGLLGANGAGKTTTLRMLAGVSGPTNGNIHLCGHDIVAQPILARRSLGYVGENSPLYPEMTVRQYLSYRSELKGVARGQRKTQVGEAADVTSCGDILDVQIAQLSRGFRQRVGLADALLSKPRILLLDEPTAGLDPNQVRELRELVQKLQNGRAIVISTHVLAEVETLCTSVLVMHHGQVVAHSTLSALRGQYQCGQLKLTLRDPHSRADSVFVKLGWCRSDNFALRKPSDALARGDRTEVRVQALSPREDLDSAIEALVSALVRADVGVQAASREMTSLEAVFSRLTQPPRQGEQ